MLSAIRAAAALPRSALDTRRLLDRPMTGRRTATAFRSLPAVSHHSHRDTASFTDGLSWMSVQRCVGAAPDARSAAISFRCETGSSGHGCRLGAQIKYAAAPVSPARTPEPVQAMHKTYKIHKVTPSVWKMP